MGSCNYRSAQSQYLLDENQTAIRLKNRTPITPKSAPGPETYKPFPGDLPPSSNYSVEGLFPFSDEDPFSEKRLGFKGPNASVSYSQSGISVTCRKGLKAQPNQDNFFVLAQSPYLIAGVLDGHGVNGHNISSLVRKLVPKTLLAHPLLSTYPVLALTDTFSKVQEIIPKKCSFAKIDCTCSGCTATVVLIYEGFMYVAYLGDSRAVLGMRYGDQIVAFPITTDHKLNDPLERSRVERVGGIITKREGGANQDQDQEEDQDRIFVPDKSENGILVTRAFGDLWFQGRGLCVEPSFFTRKIEKADKFVVICTDGVWDVLGNYEVGEMAGSVSSSDACNAIANKAWCKWIERYEDKVDDITVMILPI